jgi:NADPH:quinone reductase-like Zn-dependent oxidoreductase
MIAGRYPLPVKPDVIVASDGAGEVVAVGEAVTRARVGDRIVASMFPRWMDGPFALEHAAQLGGSLDGMLTELTALREDAIVPLPEHLSFEEAATLPCAADRVFPFDEVPAALSYYAAGKPFGKVVIRVCP